MKRFLKMVLRTLLLGIVLLVAFLFFFQHSLIWFPRHYGNTYRLEIPKTAVELPFVTREGKQCAFYLPPKDGAAPDRIWVLFCGNGSTALDWTDVTRDDPDNRDSFLLVDYPGYGLCEGTAWPASIAESSDAALGRLASHLGTTVAALEPRLNLLAHSIGCGAALEFATRHPVGRIVLAAPFTSLRAMAQRTIGWPLCWLLRHNFDNRARMAALAKAPQPPIVTIFHGANDTLIPPEMGRSLAAEFPKIATFREIPDADHNTIVYVAMPEIFAAMNQ